MFLMIRGKKRIVLQRSNFHHRHKTRNSRNKARIIKLDTRTLGLHSRGFILVWCSQYLLTKEGIVCMLMLLLPSTALLNIWDGRILQCERCSLFRPL